MSTVTVQNGSVTTRVWNFQRKLIFLKIRGQI